MYHVKRIIKHFTWNGCQIFPTYKKRPNGRLLSVGEPDRPDGHKVHLFPFSHK